VKSPMAMNFLSIERVAPLHVILNIPTVCSSTLICSYVSKVS
jgi:hypothetical protein